MKALTKPLKNTLGGIRLELALYREWAKASRTDYDARNKFFIFAQGRTGSTLLTSMLNDHSQIHCDDELLYNRRLRPRQYVRASCMRAKLPAFGFHVKCYQLTRDQRIRDPQAFLDELVAEGWKVLHLYRSNHFRHAISGLIARQRGIWHSHGQAKLRAVRLDPREVQESIAERVHFRELERKMIERYEYLEIEYERDLEAAENQQQTIDRIFDFLGLPSEAITARLKRTTSTDLSQTIENFDEIRSFLDASGHGEYVS